MGGKLVLNSNLEVMAGSQEIAQSNGSVSHLIKILSNAI